MARFLMLWRPNSWANIRAALETMAMPMPTDPKEMHEKWFAAIDDLIKKGVFEEFGFFPDTKEGGSSMYAIGKGEVADILRTVWMQLPYYLIEVHEIIPFEKGKEITMAMMKAMVEAAKK